MSGIFVNIMANQQDRSSCLYQCPVEAAFDIMGGKWKPLIVWHIGTKSLRYSDIKQAIPRISPHILSRQLKMLEENGIIIRKQYESIPPRVEHTDQGRVEPAADFKSNL